MQRFQKKLNTKCGHFNLVETCKFCQSLKRRWNEKLQKKGFKDAEDDSDRLRKWTGIPENGRGLDAFIEDKDETPWPQTKFEKEEKVLNHPEFKEICNMAFKHEHAGRPSTIPPELLATIFKAHCEGKTYRQIALEFKLKHCAVFYAIKRIKEISGLWI